MGEDPFERHESLGVPRPAPPMSNEELTERMREDVAERMGLSLTKNMPPEKSIVQKIEEETPQ